MVNIEPVPVPNAAMGRPGALDRAQARAGVRISRNGSAELLLSVPGIRCGACVATIERALTDRADVASARVNLSVRQARVIFAQGAADPLPIVEALTALGFDSTVVAPGDAATDQEDGSGGQLLRSMAIAGFGAANIMLLSVGVWSGAGGQTGETFHLISALIAVPVVAYAGRPFFASALAALRMRRTNMDVPISIGVILALVLSLLETAQGGEHVFFDAAVTLLFFLLAGRYLDHRMREKARSAVTGLARLAAKGAMVLQDDGKLIYVPLAGVAPGAVLSIAAGERVPLDAVIVDGDTDLDRALVTGEALPVRAGPGDVLDAGTLNLTGPITARVLRSADDSFLSQMMRMQTAAEGGRSGYVRIADRAARLYAPVVHTLALATFAGWMVATDGDWRTSAFVAISVLIITCPCALGLAVPVAHVVAAGRLMRMGVLMKDGGALERLAEINRAMFDKTGTLTTGTPLLGARPDDPALCAAAKALASHSVHPASRAIGCGLDGPSAEITDIDEVPGSGIEGVLKGRRVRLGRPDWVAEIAVMPEGAQGPAIGIEGGTAGAFDLIETIRPGALDALATFRSVGIPTAMISGDMAARAESIARLLGIAEVRHGATPADKVAILEGLRADGCRALMVGDGLNDAAALAAAHVSMAPADASDAGRTAADFLFLRGRLDAVSDAWRVAGDTARIVRQNLALATIYNAIAIPLAVAGMVTPLIAALAMSGSSILVTLNALRLTRAGSRRISAAPPIECSEVPA